MIPCVACGAHARPDDACPVCGARVAATRLRNTAAAALLGLTVACVGETTDKTASTAETGSVQADYGITTTTEETGSTQADYGVPSTYETGTTQSLYGVPTTTATGETGGTGSSN